MLYKNRDSKGLIDRDGRHVFVSPIYNWTAEDMEVYGQENELPENPVSPKIHMSGECLCGAFAHPGEREELKFWFPDFDQYVAGLERQVFAKWGKSKPSVWGPSQFGKLKRAAPAPGPMCHDCAPRLADLAKEAV